MELPTAIRNSYVNEDPESIHHRIQLIWNNIRRNLLKANAGSKANYDRDNTAQDFEPNWLVWWRKPRISTGGSNYKFMATWCGPFKIVTVFSDTNVSIEVNGRPKVVNVNQLKHYKGNPDLIRDMRHDQLLNNIETSEAEDLMRTQAPTPPARINDTSREEPEQFECLIYPGHTGHNNNDNTNNNDCLLYTSDAAYE